MTNDLSVIATINADHPGKYQWIKGKGGGTYPAENNRTHAVAAPFLMPGLAIFVHGVNSEGEWYEDAANKIAIGLNSRLAQPNDLQGLLKKELKDPRFPRKANGVRPKCPIIPFYWGYAIPLRERKLVLGTKEAKDEAHTDEHGNWLRADGSWGGGPFQNGTTCIPLFWSARGFIKDKVVDINRFNPVIGRQLNNCPPRLYYVHAARRLAHLVKDIRKNFPAEPINIIAHSQGTVVTLCSLFYMEGVRGPDTVILNNSPYRFDTQKLDTVTTNNDAWSQQSEKDRLSTFANAAKILKGADPAPSAGVRVDCKIVHEPQHAYDDACYVQRPPDSPQWQAEIGGSIGKENKGWWLDPLHGRPQNRGKLFVNFNPGDRVIGVSTVEGIGWRGISPKWLSQLGDNVMQRLFARGTNENYNPPPGSKTGYDQPFFFEHNAEASKALAMSTSESGEVGTRFHEWVYLDGRSETQWPIDPEKMLGLMDVLGNLKPSPSHSRSEHVFINAPRVPNPPNMAANFDAGFVRYDGVAGTAPDDSNTKDDAEQRLDFEDDVKYQGRRKIWALDDKGLPIERYENRQEVEERRRNEIGREFVPQTNHAAILRYAAKDGSSPVANVLAYDLTVGLGYAWQDEKYWNYLLDLADWKLSDPYFVAEARSLPDSERVMPPGIDHHPPIRQEPER